MDRRTFIKTAGVGSLGAAALPLLAGVQDVLAASDNQHVFIFVSFSQAPTTGTVIQPRIGMQGAGTFDPHARWVKGGGSYVLFDNHAPQPKPLIASGMWEPTAFVSYDTNVQDPNNSGLTHFGAIQPGILKMTADFAGLGAGLTLAVVCNVGAVPLLTGEEEGWELEGTPYGDFKQTGVGISHMSVGGIAIDRGA